ncbi:hypothetical protein CRG98_032957 [Punica granatum]|uniref:Cucumisin-like n=1 Tax=Punica granatum TaxID=22663 RepID=A0A2I0IRJ1_PUNGR|nr:hypothetical protein CRG98_032957 [Punica granatum]
MKLLHRVLPFLLLVICLSIVLTSAATSHDDDRKDYIVYMGDRLKGVSSTSALYMSMLQKVIGSHVGPETVVHSYKRSFHGFVAKLKDHEVQKLAGAEGVVSVFPNEKYKLHTTRSWDFLGFTQQVDRQNTVETDIIVGVLDTGIWPASDSFRDDGLGPPPSKWKGSCIPNSSNFTCSNKIIGAKYYRTGGSIGPDEIMSPIDTVGHGTHVASTVAGQSVASTSLYGLGSGTARGGVPSARIAVYKICWYDGCYASDILAAFDDAIADGVDIISLSVGYTTPRDYFNNSISIGSFHAMRNGILTSAGAGNDGPDYGTISNLSPWFLSVAASTIDRKFLTKVFLGNGMSYEVRRIKLHDLADQYPLIYAANAPNTTGNISQSRYCLMNTLDPNLVRGKIVLCDALVGGRGPFSVGAVGAVMRDEFPEDAAFNFPLPTSYISQTEGERVLSYINSSSNATATILKSTEGNETRAPYVASFSSRGPNMISRDLLKPDLAAPGVDILAAWPPNTSISRVRGDDRFSPYNIMSGTSMACPHASGAAAYVKSFNPTWSPAAIKSALITTAMPMSNKTNPEAEFAYGAGEINPLKAINPGLIYDANETDYVTFLCAQGYNTTTLRLVTGDNSTCSGANNGTTWDLNYPSFALPTSFSETVNRTFTRTVTNVGSPASTYKHRITTPAGLKIKVHPKDLSFTSLSQKLSFRVTIEGTLNDKAIVSASLLWDDGEHQVRSPIVVYDVSKLISV